MFGCNMIAPSSQHAALSSWHRALAEATHAERRAIVRELVTEVYLRRREVIAVRPTRLAERLVTSAVGCAAFLPCVRNWAGWGSSLDPHTLVKMAPAVLAAA